LFLGKKDVTHERQKKMEREKKFTTEIAEISGRSGGWGGTEPAWGAATLSEARLEGEDLEVALAGKDDGEGAAIGGDGIFADGQAVEEDFRLGLGDGNLGVWRVGAELRHTEGNQVRGFFLDGAFEIDARFIGCPVQNAEADAKARDADGDAEVADFQDFLVDKVGDKIAAGGNREAASIIVERGDFLVVLLEQVEMLEAGWDVETRAFFNGDAGVTAGDARCSLEGAAFEDLSGRAGVHVEILEGVETLGIVPGGEVDERLAVAKPDGELRIQDQRILAVRAKFVAVVFEEEDGRGVFAGAGVGIHGSGEERDGDDVVIGGPGEGVHLIGEELLAIGELLAFEDALVFAAGLHDPDVVALHIVFFGFEHAADGVDDAAVGGVGEGGDFVVDGDGWLVEVLGSDGGRESG